ncbi:AAA family ATPase [Kitasatospora gansuensis]
MPRHSPTFTGRETQLDQILAVLRPEETAATVVVTGLAGMGKTELVLQAAHRAQQEDGWFPGGVLFVDLHGYDPVHKVSPKRALATLLRALGVPPTTSPRGSRNALPSTVRCSLNGPRTGNGCSSSWTTCRLGRRSIIFYRVTRALPLCCPRDMSSRTWTH